MTNEQELELLREKVKELQERYDFLLSAVDNLPNPIFMKDKEARFFFFNRAYSEFFDMEREKYLGTTVLDLDYLPMEDRIRFQSEDIKKIEESDIISYDTSFVTSDGVEHPSFYWSRGFRDDVSGSRGLVGEIVDITKERALQGRLDESLAELKEANELLTVMAETDHASGLYNRSVLWDKGKALVESPSDSSTGTCMAMIDLDYFKRINDDYGHLKGDEVLSSFADILRSECRVSDLPIRYGGDEFLVILNSISLEDGVKVSERIRSRTEKELVLPDGKPVTASIGVIQIDRDTSFEKNLSRLDDLLYRAKTLGRNRVVTRID